MPGEPTAHPESAAHLEQARAALRSTFGYPDFRGGQAAAVCGVLAGRDVLVLMPTGGGKSLCYQVPALLLPGMTLVVSPLISLMKDQVDALRSRRVPAALLNSTLTQAESAARLDAAERGELRLLYVAPERFASEPFRARLRALQVALLAVDEAHCISQWGHEFRPSYRRLGQLRELTNCPVLALTASATPTVRRDIVQQLRLRDQVEIVGGFDRTNLSWHVLGTERAGERDAALLALLRRPRDGVAITYATTRQRVDGLADLLNRRGLRALAYHAGIRGPERQRLQEAFMREEARIVVATSAFGMGIDKPNVRLVVHYGMPADLESYYQEAGRGGRDGAAAECVLLYTFRDRFTHEFLIGQNHPDRQTVAAVFERLCALQHAGRLTALGGGVGLARALRDVAPESQVLAALRVLIEAGYAKRGRRGADHGRVRLLAMPDRIRRELVAEAGHEAETALLRALFRRHREALYDGVPLDRAAIRQLGGAETVLPLLARLDARSFLAWRPPAAEPAVRMTDAGMRALDGMDWDVLTERHRAALLRLEAMQRYAYARGCRRAFMLRYFGENPPAARCGGCDRCLGRGGNLLPGVGPPRARWFGRRR